MQADPVGCGKKNPALCTGCANAFGPAPWADGPNKAYCLAFTRENGRMKPSDVYMDGAECPFFRLDK